MVSYLDQMKDKIAFIEADLKNVDPDIDFSLFINLYLRLKNYVLRYPGPDRTVWDGFGSRRAPV